MIGWIRGRLLGKRPPSVLLDVHGVGYELEAPMTTFYELPEVGGEISLFTHQLVREDAHHLYGFYRERERNVFRLLLRVSGIGGKLALTILSGMDAAAFSRCVFEGDTASLSRLPGIGKKTAARLVMEMRDRLDKIPANSHAGGGPLSPPLLVDDPIREAISALVSLGLKPQEASQKVYKIEAKGLSSEEMIRLALQTLVK